MWAMASSFLSFLDHTQWRITVGRTPPDEWSARCRDLYLTTHNTHNRHWPISKQELIMKFRKPFITFIESIDF